MFYLGPDHPTCAVVLKVVFDENEKKYEDGVSGGGGMLAFFMVLPGLTPEFPVFRRFHCLSRLAGFGSQDDWEAIQFLGNDLLKSIHDSLEGGSVGSSVRLKHSHPMKFGVILGRFIR